MNKMGIGRMYDITRRKESGVNLRLFLAGAMQELDGRIGQIEQIIKLKEA